MALVKCKDCGADVSTEAKACLKCGRQIERAGQPASGRWLAGDLLDRCAFRPSLVGQGVLWSVVSLNTRSSGTSVIRAHLSAPEGSVNRCLFLLALALPGCIDEASIDAIFCDPDEPCWEERGLDGAGGAEVCPTGPLGYVPTRTDANEVAFTPDVSAVAVRLPPFEKTTKCATIVVGFATSSGCSMPSKEISLIAFDSAEPVPATLPTGGTIDHLTPTGTTSIPFAGVTEVRFPVATTHKAGTFPIIGIVTHSGFCQVSFDSTCEANMLEMNYKGQWSEVDSENLYFGLADCAP